MLPKWSFSRVRLVSGTTFAVSGATNCIVVGIFLLLSPHLSAAPLYINGSGSWECGFYPGGTGYGSGTSLSFTSQDAQGNPISGSIDWGNAHSSPQCTPGLQPFQGTLPGGAADGPLAGTWSYLGQTYSTTPVSLITAICAQPGCYLSISADQSEIAITLGYESSSGPAYLDLVGNPTITSSSFGQQPITFGPNYLGLYYYSNGTFTAGAPEPANWSLFLLAVALLLITRKHSRKRA